jgi:hypothetical protein
MVSVGLETRQFGTCAALRLPLGIAPFCCELAVKLISPLLANRCPYKPYLSELKTWRSAGWLQLR